MIYRTQPWYKFYFPKDNKSEYIVIAQPENFSIEKLDTKHLMSKGKILSLS